MIYITGDTHREMDIWKINPDDGFGVGKNLTREDYVIICGDFGCVWDGADGDEFWLKWLESLPWNTVFIDGNHENFDLLKGYPIEQWRGGLVHRLRSNVIHLMRGEIYDIEGHTFLSFGGGYSHDVQYRKEHESWWKDELPNKEEIERLKVSLLKAHNKVDYVLTHDIFTEHPLSKTYPIDMSHFGKNYFNVQDVLEEVRQTLEYKAWFHGHYHQDTYTEINGKPCFTLFNKVIRLQEIEEMKKHFE